MTEVYVYVDETGSCDYEQDSGPRFAIGSATYVGDHRDAMWEGMRMRAAMEARHIHMPRGFHACEDSNRTRHPWAVQRWADGKTCTWFDSTVEVLMKSYYGPWN